MTSSSESTGDVVAFLRQGVSDTGSVALADCAGPPCTYHSLFETLDTVDASAAGFLPDGQSGRARIMTVLPDGAPTAVILLALLNRATLVPANPDFTVSELSRLATNSGSTGLAILGEDPAGQAAAEALNLPVLRFDRRQASHCADVRLSRDCGAIPPAAEVSDTRLILTTSGSTGDPKAVPLTAEALFLSARNIAETLALTEEDIGVHFLPMFHIGALVDLLLAPLSAGGAVQIVKRHPLADMITSVAESGCTWLQAVPTMLRAILSQADERELARIRSRLRFVRSVSSDLPAGQHEDAEARLGVPVIQMYGMTETAGQIASMELPPAPRRPGSVGRILGPEVTILDTAGNPVRPGDTGEICVAGPTVMRGYLGTPPGTGFFGPWLRTGDLGRLEGDGTLFLTGRVKELINRGGEKISPREIEGFLLDHDGVAEAVVFARPHPTLGEEPCAAVVLDKDAAATAEDLLAHLARHLAPHKLPRHLDILQELPRLGSGKIDRRAVANAASPPPRPKARISGGADVKRLSDIWAAVLSTEAPEWDDDFFDMGGDSLLATNLVLRVERALGRDLPPGILFEAPAFGAFTEMALKAPVKATSVDPMLLAVRQAIAGWDGRRTGLHGLLLGFGTVSGRRPLFFCAQGTEDFRDLAAGVALSRPVYIMRSLSALNRFALFSGRPSFPIGRLKSEENTRRLARIYAEEIDAVQPDGPIMLGGYCQGAVVAREIACQLTEMGRSIALLVVADRVFREPTEFPSLVVWSKGHRHSGESYFDDPARNAEAQFPLGARIETRNASHTGIMRGAEAQRLAAMIEECLDAPPRPRSAYALPQRHSARIRIHAPRLARPGQAIPVTVDVTNTSAHPWPATRNSGLHLALQWLNLDGHIRVLRAATVPLEEAVQSGGEVTLSTEVAFPEKSLPLLLLADMVEDGAFWFHWRKGDGTRRLVLPLPV